MILSAQDLTGPEALSADICIVGAGAAGIALALALGDAGRDVLLVEAGGTRHDAAVQDAYRGTVTDPALHPPLDEYRERRLGGSTTIWGGRCMPLDPIDFEPRNWIPESGWPIGPEALAPYYPKANALCEAGAFDYRADTALRPGARPMIAGFRGTHFSTDRLERFSCPTDFGTRYRDRLAASPRIRLLLDAAVADIRLDPDGTWVEALDLRRRDGTPIAVSARQFVLCAGGLETARLLLASRTVHPNGIGNHHDVLGRYYMSHLAGTIGSFVPAGGRDAVWHGYDVAEDGTYCRRRLALAEDAQRAHRIGNFVARLHHPRIADPSHGTGPLSALMLGKALVPRRYRARLADDDGDAGLGRLLHHALNVARQPLAVARFATTMLVGRRFATRKYPSVVVVPRNGRYSLDFHAEQQPNRDSRVYLGTDRDAWGMPRLVADWRHAPGDIETVRVALALLAEDLERSSCGRFTYDPDSVAAEVMRYGAYPGHHIGTARMGTDPRTSMVDGDGRVHGIANLHLAGAAVFPTSSQANPTLTAVALALRLADRLAAA
ncbi:MULTISPECIES: GMC family oxidoreductase [unclassified Sphingomonas]|uniref:GMC oxidoreductase n=1 Tax=unclassified Sphingomonas TaxID=196159 RepID=UPI00226A0539